MKTWFTIIATLLLFSVNAQNRFDFLDEDKDWIDDVWETENGLPLNNLDDSYADYDDDGLSNIYEFYLGTNPLDSSDPQSINVLGSEDITDLVEDNWDKKLHLKLGAGNFESIVFLNAIENFDVIITGGWNSDFTARDIQANISIIDVITGPLFAKWSSGSNNLVVDGMSMTTTNFFGTSLTYVPEGGENFIGISNCIFTGPSEALKLISSENAVSRLLFYNNLSITSEKYAIESYTSDESVTDARIYNCTFADQIESSIFNGSGMYLASNTNGNVNLDIKNCIIWNNEFRGIDIYSAGASFNVDIDYSVLQSDNEFGGSPVSYDLSSENILQIDPELDENYLPINTSIAVDAGIDLGFSFDGLAPDLGFRETPFSTSTSKFPKPISILVSPNPLRGNEIFFSDQVELASLTNLSGAVLLPSSKVNGSLNIPYYLSNGIYLLKLEIGSQNSYEKLVINR